MIYCDHTHDYLDVKEIDSSKVGGDVDFAEISSFKLDEKSYEGQNDEISKFLKNNGAINIIGYNCPYCETLGKQSMVAFINDFTSQNRFIRLRKNRKGNWEKDDSQPYGTNNMYGNLGYVSQYMDI